MKHKDANGGFTLIELMMVIAILAILAATAVGFYKHYVKTGFEFDAMGLLTRAMTAQEQHYANTGCYAYQYIEQLPGWDDGTHDNRVVIHADRDARRRFVLSVDTNSSNCTHYKLVIHNEVPEDAEWRIEWMVECSDNALPEACKPVQVKGTELLKDIF